MGNQLAAPQKLAAGDVGEQLPVAVKDTLGGGRLIKTLLCVHDGGGLVVVKCYHKRGGEGSPPLSPYAAALRDVGRRLSGVGRLSHVWAPQAWRETQTSAFIVRQHLWGNVYDRLGTRPFLTNVERVSVGKREEGGLDTRRRGGVSDCCLLLHLNTSQQ